MDAIVAETGLLISAGTVVEALIAAARRNVLAGMELLLDDLGFEIVPLTAAAARQAGEAYRQWGKGFHAAGLNFGACFAYALAKERGCPLLSVGKDFARTDITSALP